jgi:sulfur carrier protein ThiS
MRVKINTYGTIHQVAGWGTKEVEFEKTKLTIKDILNSIVLADGSTIFNLIADKNGIKKEYIILLNGIPLWESKGLEKEISDNVDITTMDILYPVGGG